MEKWSAESYGFSPLNKFPLFTRLQPHKSGNFGDWDWLLRGLDKVFDELVNVQHAELLYAAAPEPKQLQLFEQGGHNDIFYWNRETYMQLVEAFLAAV